MSGGALNADILPLALRRPAYIAFNQKDLDKYGASLDNLAPVLAQAKTVWISVRRGSSRGQGEGVDDEPPLQACSAELAKIKAENKSQDASVVGSYYFKGNSTIAKEDQPQSSHIVGGSVMCYRTEKVGEVEQDDDSACNCSLLLFSRPTY